MNKGDFRRYTLPDAPGVYLFKKGKEVLYIGKAASLRDRVRSYFAKDSVRGRGNHIARMVEEATSISYRSTDSVLEALILEANLIKQYRPRYNIEEKDNRSFNYVIITKERFPSILVVRGRELYQTWNKADIKYLFGPFPGGGFLQEALRIVRRIFPYRDSRCIPCDEQLQKKSIHGYSCKGLAYGECKPCFNRQIGLCPGVCTGEITKEEYAEAIRNIRDLFSGAFHGLRQRLAKEMRAAAKVEQFEKAAGLRRQISALDHIRDVALIKNEMRIASGGGVRIEAYDVAHTAGTETVAVMAVVNGGEAYKRAYRTFTIRTARNDDIAALREVISRRLSHSEWQLPRIIVVDGGKAHVRTVQQELVRAGIMLPVIGVVKDEFHRPRQLIGDEQIIVAHERDIVLANSEAHRFALSFHRKRLRKRNIVVH